MEVAEENIILSARQPTANHGKYRSALTPYVRGIFDAINDVNISKVTNMQGGANRPDANGIHTAMLLDVRSPGAGACCYANRNAWQIGQHNAIAAFI